MYSKTIFQKGGNYNTKFRISITSGERTVCVRDRGANTGR